LKGKIVMEIKGYNIPEDLYYEKNHYWVRRDGDLLVMGMSDFAQQLAGDIVYVQLPFEGKKIKAGKKFAKVESGKWLGKVYAPVNGEIAACNMSLEEDPSLINQDCYGNGWMYHIRPNDMGDIDDLIHGVSDIEAWMISEIEKHGKD
jgi:glycine cleavage system H protein